MTSLLGLGILLHYTKLRRGKWPLCRDQTAPCLGVLSLIWRLIVGKVALGGWGCASMLEHSQSPGFSPQHCKRKKETSCTWSGVCLWGQTDGSNECLRKCSMTRLRSHERESVCLHWLRWVSVFSSLQIEAFLEHTKNHSYSSIVHLMNK
jgi:hypothetical protein